jgi:peptidoglycan/LPS O-acetylase OafA/YrhL
MLTVTAAESVTAPAQSGRVPKDYRPDIDGLRAIAILSVVAFHAGVRAFHGGFVGVDIFFVISGYLIGGIVYKEAKTETFSFASFYKRRAKRILPAFFAVILFCYLAAMLLLSPAELRAFAATAVAAISSTSNIQLWLSTGYFTSGSELNPLLMTWSLAVEEQFYLLFPIAMLVVVHRKHDRAVHAIALCSILSFALSVWGVAHHPTMAFFLLPTRAWELGVGVLLAIRAERLARSRTGLTRLARQSMGCVGAALLVCAVLVCRSTQFPGLAALLPVTGTLLLIESRGSMVNAVLSARPMVFVGRLSYSWYLWHWPMLSFARIASDRPLNVRATVSIALLSFAVALASFYFIEQPFRNSRTPAPRMLIRYAALLLIVLTPSLVVIAMKGMPQRRPQLAEMEARGANVTKDPCLAAYGKTAPRLSSDCVTASNTPHTVALIGDSHAAALAGALRSIADGSGYGMDEIEKASCPPLFGATIYMPNHPGQDRECAEFNSRVLNYIRSHPQIQTVVMAGFWSGPSSQPDEGFSYVPLGSGHEGVPEEESLKNLRQGLEGEVGQLRASGKQVILLKDDPALTFNPLRYEIATTIPLRRNLGQLFAPELKVDRTYASEGTSLYSDGKESAIIDDVAARHPGVRVYDLKRALCDNGDCSFIRRGSLLYVDANHLSQAGAEMALGRLDLDSAGYREVSRK